MQDGANKNSNKIKHQNPATAPHLMSNRRYISSGIIIQQPYLNLLELKIKINKICKKVVKNINYCTKNYKFEIYCSDCICVVIMKRSYFLIIKGSMRQY